MSPDLVARARRERWARGVAYSYGVFWSNVWYLTWRPVLLLKILGVIEHKPNTRPPMEGDSS